MSVDTVNRLDCDNWDNGVYIIENWEIVDRKYFDNRAEQHEYDKEEFIEYLDSKQPVHMQMFNNEEPKGEENGED